MIKKFNDFSKDEIIENENDSFERELNARKKSRQKENNDVDFNIIKNIIKDEINNDVNYHLSVGKKTLNLNDNKEEEIVIQYDSEGIGRLYIYKPKDDSSIGYIEFNDKIYEEDADDIRNFYHYLNQIIKNEPIKESNNIDDKDEYKNTICKVYSEDWEALYFDGEKFIEGHTINLDEFLNKLINNNIVMGNYKIIESPRMLNEDDLEKVNWDFPLKLKDVFNIL